MASYEACKAAAQLASQGKGSGTEDTISLDVHSINQLKVGPLCTFVVIQKKGFYRNFWCLKQMYFFSLYMIIGFYLKYKVLSYF